MPPRITKLQSSSPILQDFDLYLEVIDEVIMRTDPKRATLGTDPFDPVPLPTGKIYNIMLQWNVVHFSLPTLASFSKEPDDIGFDPFSGLISCLWLMDTEQTQSLACTIAMHATLPPDDPEVPDIDFSILGIITRMNQVVHSKTYQHYPVDLLAASSEGDPEWIDARTLFKRAERIRRPRPEKARPTEGRAEEA